MFRFKLPDDQEYRRILSIWRAVWLIVSAPGEDDMSRHVRQLGQNLVDAVAQRDSRRVAEALEEMSKWMEHLAGVVCARLTATFARFR